MRRLIVPLDGSESAEVALAHARALPCSGALLLHVLPPDEPAWLAEPPSEEEREQIRAAAEAYLDAQAATLHVDGVHVETRVVVGDPAGEIIAAAQPDDLIVMASHGAGAGGFSLFGSVADRVVRHAESPVYLVRDANVPAGGFAVGLDGSDQAERALPLVAELATALKRPVRLIRVLDTKALERAARTGTHAGDRYARSSDVFRRSMTHYLDGVAAGLNAQGLQVTTKVIDGSPAEAIASEVAPDEIVAITTRGQGGVERWLLGSVAAKLVRLVSGPLLIVR